MTIKRIVIYDFETDGLDSTLNQPIEVSVKIVEGDKIDYYHSYIKFDDQFRTVPFFIKNLTGITTQMLIEKGRPIKEVFKNLHEIFVQEGTFVVGYNISTFDNKFLRSYFTKFGLSVPSFWYFDCCSHYKSVSIGEDRRVGEKICDFHKRVMNLRIKGAKYKLSDAVNHYKIPKLGAYHTAKADVDYTHEIFKLQMKEVEQFCNDQDKVFSFFNG